MKNMEEFIQQVRNHVCLWDTNSIFFRDVARKNAAWDAVAQESGLGDSEQKIVTQLQGDTGYFCLSVRHAWVACILKFR